MRRLNLNLRTLRFSTYSHQNQFFHSKPERTKIMALNPTSQVRVTCSLQLPEMTACPVSCVNMNLLCPFCHAYYPCLPLPPFQATGL